MSKNFLAGLIGLAALIGAIFLAGLLLRQFSTPPPYPIHATMPTLQATENPLLIRTDFSNDTAWESLVETVARPVNLIIVQTRANLELVNDPAHADVSPELLIDLAKNYRQAHGFFVIADARAMTEGLVLVVDLDENLGSSFRAPLDEIALIENNLSISNVDFAEFAAMVDSQGVYRGE